MIWIQLAYFVVAFIVAALFAPKPEIEDAKIAEFDSDSFPKASENDPVPLVLGQVVMKAPNILHYGQVSVAKMTKRVRTGLFSRKTITIGYKYFASFQLGLGLGPKLQLNSIIIDDTVVFNRAIQPNAGDLNFESYISQPELFGGETEGGGFESKFRFYSGEFDQQRDPHVSDFLGPTFPHSAYRGVANIVFEKASIGESPTLHKMSFKMSCFPNKLLLDSKMDGNNINPAEAIYVIMTDEWRGLGIDESLIDKNSFIAAASTLGGENHGVSVIVTKPSEGKKVISEILGQIDGTIYEDPITNLIGIRLIRQDYNPDTLDVYDEDDILEITNFTKTSWADLVSELKVTFSKRDGDGTRVALAQNTATINMLGRRKTLSRTFPFCYSEETATEIAHRELAIASNPLYRMTIVMKRTAFGVVSGKAFKINYSKYGLNGLIVRAQKVNLGELMNNKISLEVVQDSFSSYVPTTSAPEPTAWVPEKNSPASVSSENSKEMPFFYNSRLENASPDGFSNILVLARQPQITSSGFSAVLNTGESLTYTDPDDTSYAASWLLDSSISRDDGFDTGVIPSLVLNSEIGFIENDRSLSILRTGENGVIVINDEYLGYEGYSANAGVVTLTNVRRGLFGSTISDHSATDIVYSINASIIGTGEAAAYLESDAFVEYKILDFVGPKKQSEENAPEFSIQLNREIERPLRPRNIKIDGSRTYPVVTGSVSVSWASSNVKSSTVTFENDASQSPDSSETYRLETWVDGVLATSEEPVTSPHTTDPSINSGALGEFRLYSNKMSNGLLSSGYAAIKFTLPGFSLLTSGDEQSGTDLILTSGDEQSGTDTIKLSGV